MTAQHTAGPWFIHDENGRRYIEAADDVVICTIGRWMKDGPNASLIAAAPELLDALRDILSALGGEGHDGWHSEPVHSSDVKRALNAIAKATGEST